MRLRVTYAQMTGARSVLGTRFRVFHMDDVESGRFTIVAMGEGYPVLLIHDIFGTPGQTSRPANYATDFPGSIQVVGFDF